jgi:hypothetical protein
MEFSFLAPLILFWVAAKCRRYVVDSGDVGYVSNSIVQVQRAELGGLVAARGARAKLASTFEREDCTLVAW